MAQPTRTTLSSAVASGTVNQLVTVASVTGITASTSSQQGWILVDRELMKVVSISGTTLTVRRAQASTNAMAHLSGAQVIFGGNASFDPGSGNVGGAGGTNFPGTFLGGGTANPTGAATRSNQAIVPVFAVMSGIENGFSYDVLGGKWVQGTLPDHPDAQPLMVASNIPIGSVAYGSLGTNTTDIAGQEWITSIMVERTAWVTGVKFLAGGTATTDNVYAVLRDSAGNLLANSAAAGAVLSGANTFQTRAFTAARFLVGPARYFVSVVGNGTAAGAIRTVAASTFASIVTGVAAGTFGTITATFTVPTTFTADVGPIVQLY